MGAQLLFEGGEVCGWAVCMVDGCCHHWRVGGGCWWVGGLFFVGSGYRSYCHCSWLLGCRLWVVTLAGGWCLSLMGDVIIGGWGGSLWVGGMFFVGSVCCLWYQVVVVGM